MTAPTTTSFRVALFDLLALVGENVQADISSGSHLLAIINGELVAADDVAGSKADDDEEILVTVGESGILLRRSECVEARVWSGLITFDLGEIKVTIRRVGGAE